MTTGPLPSGTVCFFMSDIEGSTRLVGRLGSDFPRLLDEHFAVLGEAIDAHAGTLVSSEGDSVFAVFRSARSAVAAAIQGQRALAARAWPGDATVRVRIGIHAGEAVFGGRDYTGLDVHRTARIMAAAHGGQILVSDAARALAGDDPAAGVMFRDLGSHVLRDMPAPERLFAVVAPGLATDLPPPRTASAATPTNLPAPLTRFVGRTRELAELGALLDRERLVTLTGPGGTGKTRLAIETGRSLLDRFVDGVWFVALDVVRDRALVLPAIASTLGVSDQHGRSPAEGVAGFLAPRRALLLLDNFEQVVEASPDIAALLAAAPKLAVLTSSREPLQVAGENVYPVPPLDLPAEPGVPTVSDIADREAVVLFVERARAARASFVLTDANAPAVAAICRRLDGLPLALELAAARMNLLAPEQILARLDKRLTLLASSRRDLPERQRTLRGAIDWSHDLLGDPERRLFRRLSVFSGGADLEVLEPVVDPDGSLGGDILELTAALVDRSLVRARNVGERNRLEMLETIREYAAEQLEASGEGPAVRSAHAAFCADLADSAMHALVRPDGQALFDRIELELGNIRDAVAWSLRCDDQETALRVGAGLREFWHSRNHLQEGRRVLRDVLAASEDAGATLLRTRATATASELASWHGDYEASSRLAEEALAMAEVVGDPAELANAQQGMGWATFMHRPAEAVALFEQSIAAARRANDVSVMIGALQGAAVALLRMHRLDDARRSMAEAIALAEAVGDRYTQAFHMLTAGMIEQQAGDDATAASRFADAVRIADATGGQNALGLALDAVASVALRLGRAHDAARLLGATSRLREHLGGGLTMAIALGPEPLEIARSALTPEALDEGLAAGRAMHIDAAVALALEVTAAAAAARA